MTISAESMPGLRVDFDYFGVTLRAQGSTGRGSGEEDGARCSLVAMRLRIPRVSAPLTGRFAATTTAD
jgi:hypothetical protein